MSDSATDSLVRYRALVAERPELFWSPPSGAFTILLDDVDIKRTEALTAERLAARSLPRFWARVGVVYEDAYVVVLRDAVRFPDGHLATYIRILSCTAEPSGVAVLAMHEGNVLLLRHFRHATRAFHLEIPRGFRTPDLSIADAARGEILEEVGANITNLVPLGSVHVDTGLEARVVELFCAAIDALRVPEAHEAIEAFAPVSVVELERMIRDAEITDSFTIMAFARARLRGLL